jgi:hypothetical protein
VGTNLNNQIIKILEELLGPASERFVNRLINSHLKKEAEELTIGDLPILVKWIKVSLALLTEDKVMIDNCEKKLIALKLSKL